MGATELVSVTKNKIKQNTWFIFDEQQVGFDWQM